MQFIGRLCNKPPSVAIDSIFEHNDNNNQDGDENNGNNDDDDNGDYAAT